MQTCTLKEYRKAGDSAGVMVLILLSYRYAAQAVIKQAQSLKARGTTLTHGEQLFVYLARQNEDLQSLGDLETIFAYRKPIAFSERESAYFHGVFPPVYTQQAGRQNHHELLVNPGIASFALRRAKELIELKRLITEPPAKWKIEHTIFEKERIYTERLTKQDDIKKDISIFKEKYAKALKGINAIFWANPDAIRHYEQPQQQPRSPSARFEYDLAVLCSRYCLAGLAPNLNPIPKRFEFLQNDGMASVSVPAYMEFDWRRNLPADVFKVLQKRGQFPSEIRLNRLSEQERSGGWGCSAATLLKEYRRLLRQLNRDEGRGKKWLWLELSDIPGLNITTAEGPDDRVRVVRRTVQRALRESRSR